MAERAISVSSMVWRRVNADARTTGNKGDRRFAWLVVVRDGVSSSFETFSKTFAASVEFGIGSVKRDANASRRATPRRASRTSSARARANARRAGSSVCSNTFVFVSSVERAIVSVTSRAT